MVADTSKEGRSMRQLHGIILFFGIFLFIAPSAPAAEVLTNDAIVTMVKAGLGEDLIVNKIKISQGQYDLSTAALLRLKTDGVSEPIIKAMLEASAKPESLGTKSVQAVAPPPAGAREAQEKTAIALYRQGKTAEAAAEFDKLIAENPNDDGLKIWKALALLEQARGMREAKAPQYKPIVLNAWAILGAMGQKQHVNPDWNLAVGKALWLNERPERGKGFVEKAVSLRPNYAEALLLLGDMAYDEKGLSNTADPTVRWRSITALRKAYENVLAAADVPPDLRAEALFKLGMVSADFEKKIEAARNYWQQAVAADPDSRYGRMAQERLNTAPTK
jgi:tetratricopeptide (TPR) repeat protein